MVKTKNGTDRGLSFYHGIAGGWELKKIKQVMTRIKQLQASVVFLQEAHMTKEK